MARINAYEDANDNLIWVVERSDGEGRKEFRSHDEAESYKNYLQSLENQEKALSQNQQIIDNQNKIIEQNRISQQTPRIQRVKQVLDPEYEEWLRYKKATDPEYQRWKAEEERKKQTKIEEEKKKAIEREREENKRYCEYQIKQNLPYFKGKIDEYYKIYKQVCLQYSKMLNVSFIESRTIEYETEEGIKTYRIVGGRWAFYGFDARIKQCYDELNTQLNNIPSFDLFYDELYKLAELGNRTLFDDKFTTLSDIVIKFHHFYKDLTDLTRIIARDFDKYSDPYYCEKYLSFRPQGFFAKQKIKRVISDYVQNNEVNYKIIKDIYQSLTQLLPNNEL